jgi:hypothetical protein
MVAPRVCPAHTMAVTVANTGTGRTLSTLAPHIVEVPGKFSLAIMRTDARHAATAARSGQRTSRKGGRCMAAAAYGVDASAFPTAARACFEEAPPPAPDRTTAITVRCLTESRDQSVGKSLSSSHHIAPSKMAALAPSVLLHAGGSPLVSRRQQQRHPARAHATSPRATVAGCSSVGVTSTSTSQQQQQQRQRIPLGLGRGVDVAAARAQPHRRSTLRTAARTASAAAAAAAGAGEPSPSSEDSTTQTTPSTTSRPEIVGDELVLVVGGAGRVGRRVVTRLAALGGAAVKLNAV